ncbi:hypothetical protein [Candidatus Poriferisodalis sp.]|uniref:hypothetical protein n=1 Tax=Candidatus Poriferisodalis sp. TaxID=3101277 RepID=UPI003B51FB37
MTEHFLESGPGTGALAQPEIRRGDLGPHQDGRGAAGRSGRSDISERIEEILASEVPASR